MRSCVTCITAGILILLAALIGCGGGAPNATACAGDPEFCLVHYHDRAVEECLSELQDYPFGDDFTWDSPTAKLKPFDVGSAEARIPASAGAGYSTRTRVEYLGEVGTGTDLAGEWGPAYIYCGYDLRDSDFILGASILKNHEEYRTIRHLSLTQWFPISP